MRHACRIVLVLFLSPTIVSAGVLKLPHVELNHSGIDETHAKAIAETIAAAREVYVTHFGFDMPETIRASVTCAPGQPSRLFTDGSDSLFLSMADKQTLTPPGKSGTFTLYGMCHELGHMAMYRVLRERDWMTTAASEGWAHYAGSVVVDQVYTAKGQDLWSDPYDYRADGTARLAKQLSSATPSPIAKGAEQWQKLDAIVGAKSFPKFFAAWNSASPDKPADALLSTLIQAHPQKKQALRDWWKQASPLLVESRQASEFKKTQIPASRLTGRPAKLAGDDDTADGKRSIAGAAQGRRFTAADRACLTAVWIHGARYGAPKPPTTSFDVVLCDDQFRPIATWPKPHAAFQRGEPAWVRLDVPPTLVPGTFYLCVNFKATATNGVYLDFDTSTQGNSVTGTPGKEPQPFEQGDWMIRVEVDQLKEADALRAN
jgi:hypothetical protein